MEYKLLPNSNCTKKCFLIDHCKENMLCERPRKVWNVLVFSGLMIPWWPVSSPTQASENQSTSSKLCFKAALVSRWWNIGILENSCFHWKIGSTKYNLSTSFFLPQPLINGGRHRWQQDYKLQTWFLLYALLCPKVFGGLCVIHSLLSVNIARCKHCTM